MSKSESKPRKPASQQHRELIEAERRAAIAKNTAEIKERVRDGFPVVVGAVFVYIIFACGILYDAKHHLERADGDWLTFIWVTAGVFGTFMVRYVLRWDGKV